MTPAPALDADTYAAQAAADREKTVIESESHQWRGIPLAPWGRALQTVYARLIALDVPGGDPEEIPALRARFDEMKARENVDVTFEQCANLEIYLPAAQKVLFLAAEPPDQWFHLRGQPARLLARIEAWGAEHIPPEETAAACTLAAQILTEHRALVPMHRPHGSPARAAADAGN